MNEIAANPTSAEVSLSVVGACWDLTFEGEPSLTLAFEVYQSGLSTEYFESYYLTGELRLLVLATRSPNLSLHPPDCVLLDRLEECPEEVQTEKTSAVQAAIRLLKRVVK